MKSNTALVSRKLSTYAYDTKIIDVLAVCMFALPVITHC